jgi:hypothetical protein
MARLVFFVLFLALLGYFFGEEDGGDPAPRRPAPRADVETVLPAASAGDPIYLIKPGEPCARYCRGSAFAIDRHGHWLTARHVVQGCRRVDVVTEDGRRIPVERIKSNLGADVSLLVTRSAVPAVPVNFGQLRRRQDGFHFGFPKGKPGAVHSQLLGRANARRGGPNGPGEPIIAWAEVSRSPAREGSLGGLSGGVVLDSSGAAVSLTTAESPRRGRVLSAAPSSLRELLRWARLRGLADANGEGGSTVTPGNYSQVGSRLRRRRSVALVLCQA